MLYNLRLWKNPLIKFVVVPPVRGSIPALTVLPTQRQVFFRIHSTHGHSRLRSKQIRPSTPTCPDAECFSRQLVTLEEELDAVTREKTPGTFSPIPNIMGGTDRIALRYAFYEDCLRRIAYEPAKSITAPTVIVQGEQDEHVPLHQSRRLYDALHVKKHLELLPGADHQFTKREDFTRMTNVIADWLTSYLTAP